MDENGFVRITDFGIAKIYSSKNYNETSGTPGYMSPEVMKGQNHSYTVDYFALGVIGYEFMLGRRPYIGRSRKEIKEQMMSKQAYIKLSDIPNGWTDNSADFFNKLLIRKPENRLGFKGIFEIKDHPWLKFFEWDLLKNKKMDSPFIPAKKDNFDKRYCESADRIGNNTKERYEKYMKDDGFSNLFINFTYYNIGGEDYTLNDKEIYNNYDNEIYNDFYHNQIKKSLKIKSKGNINVNYNRNNKSLSITTSFVAKQSNKKINNGNNILNNSTINNKSLSQRSDRGKSPVSARKISLIRSNNKYDKLKKSSTTNMNSSLSSYNFMQIYRKKCKSISPIDYLQMKTNKSYTKNALLSTSRREKIRSKSVNKESNSPIRNSSINSSRSYVSPNSKRKNSNNYLFQLLSENRKKRIDHINNNKINKNCLFPYAKKIQKNGSGNSELLMQIRHTNNMKLKKNIISNYVGSKCKKNVNKFGNIITKNNSTKLSFEVELNSLTSNLSNNLKKLGHNNNNETKVIKNNYYNINGMNVNNNNININLIFRDSNGNNVDRKMINKKMNPIKNQDNDFLKQSNSVNFLFKNYKMGINSNIHSNSHNNSSQNLNKYVNKKKS